MQTKLQELTEKIYNEGVAKAKAEAEKIKAEAEKQAKAILEEAEKQKSRIIADAEKQARELERNIKSEIKLASRQAINELKQQITNLVVAEIVEKPTKSAFDDDKFIKELIEIVMSNWDEKRSQDCEVNVYLPKKHEQRLNEFFKQKFKRLLDKGLTVSYEEQLKSGFQIGPKDGSYKISFTDNDFEQFFKAYLRPRTIKLLYQEDEKAKV